MPKNEDPQVDSSALAEIEEDDKIEQPIQLVGEFVKSGRKILADYDSATGAVTVRPKWKHLADLIQEEIEEHEESKRREGSNHDSQEVEAAEALAALEAAEKDLDKEASKIEKEKPEGPPIPDDLPPWARAVIESQNRVLEQLADNAAKNDENARISRSKGVVAEGLREIKVHRDRLKDDLTFAQKAGVPLPPKKNPRFGDKTPAYVNWLREHRPDVYEERYGVTAKDRTVRKVTRAGDIVEAQADIARRKTHRSEKLESDPTLADDMDWNA